MSTKKSNDLLTGLRAAAYCRYSTEWQTDNSIAYQLNSINDYCAETGLNLIRQYKDEAQTGSNTNRDGFQSMIRDAKKHLFDAIVIYDVTRLSRDLGDWFSFRKEMLLCGVQVLSAKGELGSPLDPAKFVNEALGVLMGQHELLNTRQKSRDGVHAAAERGVFLGGYAPYGYKIVDQNYVIDETEARYIREIFKMYADGCSYGDIIDKMSDITTRHGKKLGKSTLYSILTNERYIGVYTWNKKVMRVMHKWAGGKLNPDCVRIEDAIPAIVDKDTWEKVRIRMKSQKKGRNKAVEQYLLSGLIECDKCGGAYVGHCSTNTKGYKTRYYVCGTKYRNHDCDAKNVNADAIEEFAIMQIKQYIKNLDVDQTAETIASQFNSAAPDLSREKTELQDVMTQITNGTKAILKGLVYPELQDEIDRLRARKSELEDIIARNSVIDKMDPKALAAALRHAIDSSAANPALLIKTFVQKIYANHDGSFSVIIGVHLDGFPCWTRTNDPAVNSRMLYQLS